MLLFQVEEGRMDVHGFPVRMVDEATDWPAWVQAVGSIVAIFFAVQVARKQQLEQTAARVTALDSLLQFVRSVIADALNAYEEHAAGSQTEEFDIQRLVYAETALRAMPVYEVGQDSVAGMIFQVLGYVHRVQAMGVPGRFTIEDGTFSARLFEMREINLQTRAITAGTFERRKFAVRKARFWWLPFA